MSIVFMEQCITPKGAVADRARKEIRKNSVRGCVSLQKIIICLCRPARLTRHIQTRANYDFTEWRALVQCWQHSNPGLTAAPQISCRRGVNFTELPVNHGLNHRGLMLNRLDGSGSASTARLHQIGSTSPAWAASKTQAGPGPCHFRVKSANSRRLGVGEPATLRLQTDSDVTGSGMPPPPSPPPPPLHLQEYG